MNRELGSPERLLPSQVWQQEVPPPLMDEGAQGAGVGLGMVPGTGVNQLASLGLGFSFSPGLLGSCTGPTGAHLRRLPKVA